MPSTRKLVSLFPFDIANPFVVDAFLRHLTVFSHVFPYEDLEGADEAGLTLTALNGNEVTVRREGEEGK